MYSILFHCLANIKKRKKKVCMCVCVCVSIDFLCFWRAQQVKQNPFASLIETGLLKFRGNL